ncbi:MAG TPA: hypothetical protein VF549_09310 [Solirubrobacteraceae bacterium]|jgi:hypothetical protein
MEDREERVSLSPLDGETALRALLKVDPAKTERAEQADEEETPENERPRE